MATCNQIDRTMPVALNASRIVITDDPRFVELAKQCGNDALLRVGTPLADSHHLSPSEAEALFHLLDVPENAHLIEGVGELQCVSQDDMGRPLLSAWIPIDQGLTLLPTDHPQLGSLHIRFAAMKEAGAQFLDFDFYRCRPRASRG